MSNITAYPLQDWFETTLAQSWNGAVGTVYLNTAPSFTFPSGVKTYIVVNPWKTNMQVGEIDSLHVWNKTVNVSSISVGSWAGTTYTQESHSVWSTVIISDNYQFWKNIIDAVNTKIDWVVQGIYFYADATARDAALWATPSTNWLIVWLTSEGKITYSLGGAWVDVGTGATFVNASATAAGKVEIATTWESQAGTDTGWTGALLSVLPSDIAKNIQSSTFIYGADVWGDDTYVFALTPVLTTYTTWQSLYGKVTTANTGACTADFWPWVVNIKTLDGNDPQTGVVNGVCHFIYDGTNLVLQRSDYATSSNRWDVELATDAETITGTSTTLAVTPASYKAAVTQALVWGDFNKQYDLIFYPNGATNVLNSSAANNFSGSGTAGNILYFNVASDAFINAQLPGKPNTANTFLRWDDITTLEFEFTASFTSPWAGRYFSVWLADTSATTGWTDITSVQRRVFLQAGNNTGTTVFVRTADGTTTSASSAITATYTNWNTYKMTFNKGTNVLTYLNGTLVDTKTTNLPTGTNLVNIGVGLDSWFAEDMYLWPITVRIKYA